MYFFNSGVIRRILFIRFCLVLRKAVTSSVVFGSIGCLSLGTFVTEARPLYLVTAGSKSRTASGAGLSPLCHIIALCVVITGHCTIFFIGLIFHALKTHLTAKRLILIKSIQNTLERLSAFGCDIIRRFKRSEWIRH